MAELIAGMFNSSSYKRTQGRIARQLTFAAIATAVAVAAYKLSGMYEGNNLGQYVMPLVLLVAGLWGAWRIVNIPSFADFLISVEAEMNKVSWPARSELWRASVVVIFVIFALAGLLTVYDFLLTMFFDAIL